MGDVSRSITRGLHDGSNIVSRNPSISRPRRTLKRRELTTTPQSCARVYARVYICNSSEIERERREAASLGRLGVSFSRGRRWKARLRFLSRSARFAALRGTFNWNGSYARMNLYIYIYMCITLRREIPSREFRETPNSNVHIYGKDKIRLEISSNHDISIQRANAFRLVQTIDSYSRVHPSLTLRREKMSISCSVTVAFIFRRHVAKAKGHNVCQRR